jgi:hypothetical protein
LRSLKPARALAGIKRQQKSEEKPAVSVRYTLRYLSGLRVGLGLEAHDAFLLSALITPALLSFSCELRKPTPWRPAFEFPIAQFDVVHDCLRNHVALGLG